MEKSVKPGIQELLEATVTGGKAPTVEEFLEHFFAAAGGAQAVARHLFQEFSASKPGSLIRTRVLELIVRSLKFAEGKGRDVDMGLLSDDDLEALVTEKMASIHARTQDGSKSATA